MASKQESLEDSFYNKFSKLGNEYAKLKKEYNILKPAVIRGQEELKVCEEKLHENNESLRKQVLDLDALQFKLQRLRNHFTKLQKYSQKLKAGRTQASQGGKSWVSSLLGTDNDVDPSKLSAELTVAQQVLSAKCEETERVHIEIFELKNKQLQTIEELKKQIEDVSQTIVDKELSLKHSQKTRQELSTRRIIKQKEAELEEQRMRNNVEQARQERKESKRSLTLINKQLTDKLQMTTSKFHQKVMFDDTQIPELNEMNGKAFDFKFSHTQTLAVLNLIDTIKKWGHHFESLSYSFIDSGERNNSLHSKNMNESTRDSPVNDSKENEPDIDTTWLKLTQALNDVSVKLQMYTNYYKHSDQNNQNSDIFKRNHEMKNNNYENDEMSRDLIVKLDSNKILLYISVYLDFCAKDMLKHIDLIENDNCLNHYQQNSEVMASFSIDNCTIVNDLVASYRKVYDILFRIAYAISEYMNSIKNDNKEAKMNNELQTLQCLFPFHSSLNKLLILLFFKNSHEGMENIQEQQIEGRDETQKYHSLEEGEGRNDPKDKIISFLTELQHALTNVSSRITKLKNIQSIQGTSSKSDSPYMKFQPLLIKTYTSLSTVVRSLISTIRQHRHIISCQLDKSISNNPEEDVYSCYEENNLTPNNEECSEQILYQYIQNHNDILMTFSDRCQKYMHIACGVSDITAIEKKTPISYWQALSDQRALKQLSMMLTQQDKRLIQLNESVTATGQERQRVLADLTAKQLCLNRLKDTLNNFEQDKSRANKHLQLRQDILKQRQYAIEHAKFEITTNDNKIISETHFSPDQDSKQPVLSNSSANQTQIEISEHVNDTGNMDEAIGPESEKKITDNFKDRVTQETVHLGGHSDVMGHAEQLLWEKMDRMRVDEQARARRVLRVQIRLSDEKMMKFHLAVCHLSKEHNDILARIQHERIRTSKAKDKSQKLRKKLQSAKDTYNSITAQQTEKICTLQEQLRRAHHKE